MALLGSFLNCKSTNDRAAGEVLEGFKSLLHLNSDVNRQVVYEHQGCMKKIHGVSFGSQLVVTHIRPILGFLSMKLSAKGVCQPIYLDILHSVSEHITDSAICEVFSRTLLKVLKSGTSLRNDYVTNLLNTISKFVCKVEEPSSFIMNIFSLLPTTLVKESRKALVSVIFSLKNNPNLLNGTLASQIAIIVDLESWDPRRVDEPDFEVRHAAFSALSRLCEASEQIDRNCLSAYVQVVSYSLRTASDLSLKSSASSCLGDLTRYVGKGVNHDQEILSRSFIPECLHGLHHKDEAIRLEFLSFLASLVRHCSFHSQLGKLRCLLSDDVETDFFAGAGHIQVHRRQRAFFALSRSIESNEVDVPVSVLIRFVFPIVHPYLLNFTSKTSALSDQALILFTTILKKASWSKYFFVLNGYIKQLLEEQDKDKPIIRVVVKIIDSFHFNVTDVEIPNDFTIASYSENKPEPDDYENEGKPEPDDHEDEGKLSNERNLFIIRKIVAGILPKLRKCIDGKGDQNLAHKKAEKYYSEDDDILRAPIALATVKLLKKLPPKILDQHLHGVILKLNSLILSRSYNVREVARKTMISVLQVLGTVYLPFVIREMKQIMNKGYQVHVMIYTVHVLISAMKEDLKSGDLDSCLLDIMEICKIDQFSDVTEEKSVGGIINHVAEAKAEKSIETYFFIGSFISKASLNVPVAPLMKIIEEKPQSKTIKTVSRLLDSYSSGLCSNQGIDVPTLLVFAYQTLTRYTAAVDGDDKTVQREEPQSLRPQSCLILPKAPTRIGVIVKASIKSKSFVFVEFALSLLNAILKRSKTTFTSEQLISHLDPFVQHVVHCLRLKYDRVVSNALRSIVSMLEHPLPQLKASISKIVESLFVLLADYAGMGRAGDKISVLELTQNLFKAFTRIIKDCPVEILTSKRIQILLTYMETDITDPHKQATAFSLLKAIVSKKISDEKLPPLMQHLSELSVLSHTANIRAQCRQVVIAFVANHPMGKDVEKFIEFFLAQLDYEHEDGRLSAIETLNLAFTTFVENVVDKFALVAFIRLSMGLVNESSQDCKRYMALALRNLVQFCSEKARNELCAVAKDWLNSNNDSSKFLAAKALMEFSEAVPTLLVSRVPEICKMISSMLTEEFIDESSEDTTVALFTLLSKLTAKYPAQVLQIFSAHAATFWENYRYFAMCMDSPLIQTASAEFLGQYFSASGSQQGTMKLPLEAAALGGFMFWQLKSNKIGENQSQQVIKNLVFLGKNSTDPEFYQFFAQKMKNVCKHEISHLPDQAIRRLSMFKLSAALFLSGSKDLTEELVSNMMLFFTRELNGKSDKYAEELKQLAAEVCDILKGVIGEKRYNDLLVDAQRDLTKRAGERKRQRKELAVLDPELAAQEKLRKHRARVVAQKRKIEEYKPYRKQKRLRREGSEEL
ncbi:hypothetical protein L596_003161 [Steinernema carpocapsae]|uniref:Uncharacterized protein n=1 Tax=Steinernema carpocapsae TaxID=34508 RepID=A0A4U8URB6_STECR|nr:hypothetical protein L596_003161 [Steinernema carpocapsae]